jgi:hypothetical protein
VFEAVERAAGIRTAERVTKGLEIAFAAVSGRTPPLHSDDRVEEALALLPQSEGGLV